MTSPSATVYSIQGERTAQRAEAVFADQGYVDDYARKCSDGIVSRAFREAIATQGMDEEAEKWAKDALRVGRKAARAQVAKQAEGEP